jgi:hypothetical protein
VVDSLVIHGAVGLKLVGFRRGGLAGAAGTTMFDVGGESLLPVGVN